MSESLSEAAAAPLTYLERLVPGQTHAETRSMLGRGSLVFICGMALAAASFVVERAVIRAFKRVQV